MPVFTPSHEARFWSHVEQRDLWECWYWLGDHGRKTYGLFLGLCASRVALHLSTGEDPLDKVGMHYCDNPPCCNPLHLSWGTPKQNVDDAISKGRMVPPPNSLRPTQV